VKWKKRSGRREGGRRKKEGRKRKRKKEVYIHEESDATKARNEATQDLKKLGIQYILHKDRIRMDKRIHFR
jgi:hypothetical protein